MSPTSGSLCTGYGGLDLAVDALLGPRTVWHAELDPHAALVLENRFPGVPNLGDITAVDWATVEPVDVLTAGFPCQDLSYAGKGAGITEGTRSGLWFDIADAVGVLRPRLVLLENVAAIIARRPGLDVVLADLARLGFDARWTCLRAADIGAPHGRKRWFLAAVAQDTDGEPRDQGRRAAPRQASRGRSRTDARRRDPIPAADTPRDGRRQGWPESEGEQRRPDAALGGPPAAADTHDGSDDGQRARPQPRGGGEVAADTHSYGRARLEGVPGGRDAVHADERGDADRRDDAPAAVTVGGGRTGRTPDQGRGPVDGTAAARGGEVDWGDYTPAIRRWEAVVGRPAPHPLDERGRLNPVLVEWMMGLPAGWVTDIDIPRNAKLRALGNGVVPQQAYVAFAHLLDLLVDEVAA